MHSANRAFEASVMIRGRPVKEVHHLGKTYVEGRSGTEYTLEFRSHENRRVLVIPSVDGLCVADGKPAGRNSPGFIVEPHQSIQIPGWVVDTATAAKFVFWPQDARGQKTYVEELHRSGARVDVGNQGMIGFLVLEEEAVPTPQWTGGINPARYLRADGSWAGGTWMNDHLVGVSASMPNQNISFGATSINAVAQNAAPLGTGFGEATDFSTRTGEFKRGRTIGEFVFEYDTLRGLKDRGVPIQFFTGSDKLYGGRTAFPADRGIGCTPPTGWKK